MARSNQAPSKARGRCHSRWVEGGWSRGGRCWAGGLHADSICQRSRWWQQGWWGRCNILGDQTDSMTVEQADIYCWGRFSSTKCPLWVFYTHLSQGMWLLPIRLFPVVVCIIPHKYLPNFLFLSHRMRSSSVLVGYVVAFKLASCCSFQRVSV